MRLSRHYLQQVFGDSNLSEQLSVSAVESDYSKRSKLCQVMCLTSTSGITGSTPRYDAGSNIPERIMQYWDGPLPEEVSKAMSTWRALNPGFEYHLYDSRMASEFIGHVYGEVVRALFDALDHPVARSDVFRFLYIYERGGTYIDADEEALQPLLPLMRNARLILACRAWHHDQSKEVPVEAALLSEERHKVGFYVNNAPLFSVPRHPFIGIIVAEIISVLKKAQSENRPLKVVDIMPPNKFSTLFCSHLVSGVPFLSGLDDAQVTPKWYGTFSRERWFAYKQDTNWRKQ